MTALLNELKHTTMCPEKYTSIKSDVLQASNFIIARFPNEEPRTYQSGRNKFYHHPYDAPIDRQVLDNLNLGEGLMALRGFYSSLRVSTYRFLLNVNVQTSAFYPAISVADLMTEFSRNLGENNWLDLERFLHLRRVMTSYLKDKDGVTFNRARVIKGFSHDRKAGGERLHGKDHGNAHEVYVEGDAGERSWSTSTFNEVSYL